MPQNPDLINSCANVFATKEPVQHNEEEDEPTPRYSDSLQLQSEFIRYEEERFKKIMEMDGITPEDVM